MPTMAGRSASPIVVETEEHSHSVLFTYFKGDIGSMVDAHFNRALSKAPKTKASVGKIKKIRKSVKSEPESNSCQWSAPKQSWSEEHFTPMSGRLQLGIAKEACSSIPLGLGPPDEAPSPWPFGRGLGLPPMPYSHALSQEGLGIAGQQYTNSLLNLLHNDRAEMALGMASGSKTNMMSSWTGHSSFRDPTDPAGSLDSGIALEKKDLYWY